MQGGILEDAVFVLILRSAGWIYRFCFPGSFCFLDILLCLFPDITLACVTLYSAFWMTEWLGGNNNITLKELFLLLSYKIIDTF